MSSEHKLLFRFVLAFMFEMKSQVSSLPPSQVKVRVGEYDASGFNPPETRAHVEYTVGPTMPCSAELSKQRI